MTQLLTVSPSPHNYGTQTVQNLMYGVLIALIPSFAVSLWFFGLGALIITLTAVAASVFFEWFISKYLLKKEPSLLDGSAVLTGVLLAFNVPSNLPLWILVIGAAVAIGVAKMSFGGLGNNLFNPALVGRVFMLISFPVQMTSWPVPVASRMQYIDAVTGATPLAILKEGVKNGEPVAQIISNANISYLNMFLGEMGGSLGEVGALAILIGLVYMLIKKIITWHIPVSVLGSLAVVTGAMWLIDPAKYADPMFHLLAGGVMLGAVFMATDYVTSPMNKAGMIVFGIGIGVLTAVIRLFGAYPEGISFAILIMNAVVPIINSYIKPKRFGEEVKNGSN